MNCFLLKLIYGIRFLERPKQTQELIYKNINFRQMKRDENSNSLQYDRDKVVSFYPISLNVNFN